MEMQFMTGEYDYRLVILSLIVAIVASYTALVLAERVTTSPQQQSGLWLSGGAFAMGTGIWAMHFIAMLALAMPMAMGYDVFLTLVSWFMGVAASAVALYFVSRTTLSVTSLLLGASFMATGIVGMHYTGMYAMQMQPGIVYDPILVAASVIVAFGVSLTALLLAFKLRNDLSWAGIVRKVGAASLMGIAVCGMHYTAMAASKFPMGSASEAVLSLDPTRLATVVGAATLLLLGTLLTVSILDQRRDAESSQSVDSLRKANAELSLRNLHDPLTQLPNYDNLLTQVEQAVRLWRQEQTTFAIVHIDLNEFKTNKAEQGTQRSTKLLRRVAHALKNATRVDDVIARVDGGEFVLLLKDLHDRDPLSTLCANLARAVSDTPTSGPQLSTHIGFALCPDDGTNATQLVVAADRAMNTVKTAAGNGGRAHQATADEQRVVRDELEFAIRNGDLNPYYQPQYATNGHEIVGAEAVPRWRQRQADLITPDYFMHVAEQSGLVIDLERCMLESVCADIRHWLDSGLHVPPVAVNMSALHVQQKDFPGRVASCLEQHNLPPEYLCIGITESQLMHNVEDITQTISRLGEAGIQTVLDDFGAGHSSLPYLGQLAVQQVKIGRSLVSTLTPGNDGQQKVVATIVSLAHALQLAVVAEGVETEHEAGRLRAMHCDRIQSHMLCRPIPATTYAERLRTASALEKPGAGYGMPHGGPMEST